MSFIDKIFKKKEKMYQTNVVYKENSPQEAKFRPYFSRCPANCNLYAYGANNPVHYIDPDGKYNLENFKSDVLPAVNLDFGYDYTQYASQSWNNGKYLEATMYELDATCEIVYDAFLAYGGAKAVNAIIKAGSMLKNTLSALSSSSTVVLGRYSEGSCGGYTKMADKIGASYFQLPSKVFNVLEKIKSGDSNLGKIINNKWLNGVIDSGARILLNSDPSKAPAGSAYAMEVQKLAENGYKFEKVVEKGIECWEATK